MLLHWFIIPAVTALSSADIVPISTSLDSYTKSELELLPMIRERVKHELTLQYMFQNKYLVRFLRASDWNVDIAVIALINNVRWRTLNQADMLIFRNFSSSKYARRFPFYFTSTRDNRPMVSAIKDANLRQMVLSGEIAEMRRYVLYALERCIWNLHLTSNRTGKEIIEGILLFNMAGFNMRTQGCVACLPFWLELVQSYEHYYPQLAKKIIVINTPRIFHSVFVLMKPLATGHTLKAVQLHGIDQTEWGPIVFKDFEKEKLTKEFGGVLKHKMLYRLTSEHLKIILGPAASTELLVYQ